MAYWDGAGDAESYVQNDCAALRQRFESSRRFLERMEWLYDRRRAPRVHGMRGYNAQNIFNDTSKEQMRRSLFTSNHVKEMVKSFLNRMVRSNIVVNVAMVARDAAEGGRQSNLEQLCQGILSRQLRLTVERKQGTSFIRRMSAFAARRASIAQRIDVKNVNGRAEISWELYDPFNCFFDYGDKPRRVFEDTYLRKDVIEARIKSMGLKVPAYGDWGAKKSDEMLCWTDFWCEYDEDGRVHVDNAILVDGHFVREPTSMDYGRLPISAVCINNGDLEPNAYTYGAGSGVGLPQEYIERIREPFYESLEDTIPQFEDLMSLEMLAAAFASNPPHVLRKVDDRPGMVEVEHEAFGPGATVILPEGWVRDPLQSVAQSLDKFASPTELRAQIERVWPSILFGATSGANESGFLYTQRIDQGQNAIVNPALAVSLALQLGLEEVLYQFRHSGDAEMDLRVKEDPDSEKYTIKTFRAADLPEDGYELAVTVPPMLPNDEYRQVQIFDYALKSGMLDERLALATIGKVQDPESVMQRKRLDRVRNSQPAQEEDILRQMYEEADALAEAADREEDTAERNRLMLAAIRAKRRAKARDQMMDQQAPGFQMQPQSPGQAPAQLPPEANGVMNPSYQRVLAGVAPPGGRPSLEDEDGGF